MKELPKGWADAGVHEIAGLTGFSTDPSKARDELFTLYSVPSFDRRLPEEVPGRSIGSNKQIVVAGTLLVCKINPRISRVWIVGNGHETRILASTEWIALEVSRQVDSRYVNFYLQSEDIRQHLAANAFGVGGSLMRIRPAVVLGLRLPLPPVAEQRRIVAEIDKQFTRIDQTARLLDGLRSRLARFKSSGLRDVLRCLDGCAVKPFGSIIENLRNGIPEKPVGDDGLEILKISAVRPFQLRLEERRFIPDNREYDQFKLRQGDLLFTRYNGNREFVGICASVPELQGDFFYPDKLIRVRLRHGHNPHFYELMFNAGPAREHIRSRIRTTAGQSGISGADLKSAPVPVVAPEQQATMATRAEIIVSAMERLATDLRRAELRFARLRQAILAKAFSGQLVPQDPNDEPASVLLERIRAERRSMQKSRPNPRQAHRRTREATLESK